MNSIINVRFLRKHIHQMRAADKFVAVNIGVALMLVGLRPSLWLLLIHPFESTGGVEALAWKPDSSLLEILVSHISHLETFSVSLSYQGTKRTGRYAFLTAYAFFSIHTHGAEFFIVIKSAAGSRPSQAAVIFSAGLPYGKSHLHITRKTHNPGNE